MLTIEELCKKLPSLEVMLSEYHIPSDAAFYLMRPMLVHSINVSISVSYITSTII